MIKVRITAQGGGKGSVGTAAGRAARTLGRETNCLHLVSIARTLDVCLVWLAGRPRSVAA